jgi:hypothetical protein
MTRKSSMKCKETISDRLCAFTAWTLLEDKNLFWEHSKKQNLDMIWNHKPANGIKRNHALLEKYESIYGMLESETDPSWLRNSRNRIDEWLRHPPLIEWTKIIRDIANNSKPKPVSFFSIFNEDERSIRKRLVDLNLGFAYLSYMQSSMLIHGSSTDQFFVLTNDHVAPKFFASHDDAEDTAKSVCSFSTNIILLLAIIQKRLYEKSTDVGINPI